MMSMKVPRTRTIIVFLLLAAGLFLRILYLLSFSRLSVFDFPCGPDIAEYWRISSAFLKGSSVPSEELIHAPLYPLFLAGLRLLSGGSIFAVRLIQSASVLLSGLLFYSVLRDEFRSGEEEKGPVRFVPEGFLLIFSLYPPFLMWQCDFFSENLLIIFLGFAVYLLHRAVRQTGRRALLLFASGGTASALAALTHPVSLFFTCGVFIYLTLRKPDRQTRRRTVEQALLFSAAFLAVLAPFSLSRSLRAEKFVLIQQNSALNLYIGNHENASGTCCIPPGDEWNRLHAESGEDPAGPDAFFLKKTVAFLREKPFSWLGLLIKKAFLSFSAEELTTWSDLTVLELTAWHRYGFRLFPVLAVPALAALFCGLAEADFRRRSRWFLILFFSFWAAQILLVTSGRYRIPMVLAMMAFAPWFLLSLSVRIRQGERRKVLCSTGALILAAVPVFFPYRAGMPEREREAASMIRAEALYEGGRMEQSREILLALYEKGIRSLALLNRLGSLELDSGHPREAMRYLEQAMAALPPNSPLQGGTLLNLGRAAELQGDPGRAEACYRAAEERLSGQGAAGACFNLGTLHQKAGDSDGAQAYYRKALDLDPLNPAPLRNLAILALEKDDPAGAKAYLEEACRLDPEDPQRKLDLAYVLHLTGEKDRALELLNGVLEKYPENERAKELRNLIPQR